MKNRAENESEMSSRRNFLKKVGVGVGLFLLAELQELHYCRSNEKTKSGKKIKLLSPDGTLVEVDQDDIKPAKEIVAELKEEARTGLPNRKFTMVIDLAQMQECKEMC